MGCLELSCSSNEGLLTIERQYYILGAQMTACEGLSGRTFKRNRRGEVMTGSARSHWFFGGDRKSDSDVTAVSEAVANKVEVGMMTIGLWRVARCASMTDVYTPARSRRAEREPRLVEIQTATRCSTRRSRGGRCKLRS